MKGHVEFDPSFSGSDSSGCNQRINWNYRHFLYYTASLVLTSLPTTGMRTKGETWAERTGSGYQYKIYNCYKVLHLFHTTIPLLALMFKCFLKD